LDDAPLGQLTWDRFEQVMGPKAEGGWHLHCATLGCELDFFVLFSSWASIAGKRGGANYAAASVALDTLAQLRRTQGLPGLSLDWGTWADIGWAARLGEAMPAWAGFGTMKPELALDAMAWAIRHARSGQLAIAPLDWARLKTTLGRSGASVFSEFVAPSEPEAGQANSNAPNLRDVIASASAEAAHSVIVAHLQVMAAAALGIEEPGHIDPEQPLQDLGLDSIMAVDLRNTLAQALGESLPAAILFDHPRLNSLADYSIGLLSPKQPDVVPVPPREHGDDLLALIERLTDAEVDARLRRTGVEPALS
jgi:acyl carrier protein